MDTEKLFPTKTRNHDDELPATADEAPAQKGKLGFNMPEVSGQQVSTVLCSLFLVGLGALGMHTLYPFIYPVTFKKISAHYESIGQPFKAKVIEQMTKICPDSAGTDLACLSLDAYQFPVEISQAGAGGFRK